MKTAFSVLALSGALLLTGISSVPASAQANPVNDPHAIQYSWGVIVSPPEGRDRSYTWQELGRSGAPSTAQSRSAGQKLDANAGAAIVNDPHAIQYSWGVIVSPPEGRDRSYTWQELGRSAAPSIAQSRSAGPKLDASARASSGPQVRDRN